MSRSNPQESAAHPSKRWVEYNGEFGTFKFYDKEAIKEDGSKGENINLGAKFMFLYLDTTYTVTGWSEANGCGLYGTEVKDISNGILTVKPFKGNNDPKIGTWNDIKNEVKAMGGKFTANIYMASKGKSGELEISVLQLKGSAYAAWNEFTKSKGKAIYDGAIKVASHKDGKKGSVTFKTPIFGMMEVSPESNTAAVELDKELQNFLKEKLAQVPVKQEAPKAVAQEAQHHDDPMVDNTPPPPTDEPLNSDLDDDGLGDDPF